MNRHRLQLLALIGVLVIFAAGSTPADNVEIIREPAGHVAEQAATTFDEAEKRADYTGTIRVYIVEPESRWWDVQGIHYDFGFLDFGLVEAIMVPENGVWQSNFEWNATTAGWSGVTQDNIQATVALFNSSGYTADAYPGYGYWFTAHDADAAAAATPGTVGWNETAPGFTHTVFIEQGTSTSCGYCPAASAALDDCYTNYDYPMHYVALIGDRVQKAYDRLNLDYNFPGYPSVFFDGGDSVMVGGPSTSGPYRQLIQDCGQRTVAPLDMVVAVDWLQDYRMAVRIKIGNNVPANTAPPIPASPSGPVSVQLDAPHDFEVTVSDPDNDSVLVQFDWGDGSKLSEWMGPFASSEVVAASHSYAQPGTYEVKARVDDRFGEVTEWSAALSVYAACCLGTTGNVNNDPAGNVDLPDVIFLVNALFLGGQTPVCPASANVNGDQECNVDLPDVIYLVNSLFLGGPAPVPCDPACE
ncbi:PKD domain-containing protein [candidate division GN15 bacterium]|nr:PKD domain-containing protein [candidate division GN15 bacterium]